MDINDFSIAELEQSAWEDSDYPSYVVQKKLFTRYFQSKRQKRTAASHLFRGAQPSAIRNRL